MLSQTVKKYLPFTFFSDKSISGTDIMSSIAFFSNSSQCTKYSLDSFYTSKLGTALRILLKGDNLTGLVLKVLQFEYIFERELERVIFFVTQYQIQIYLELGFTSVTGTKCQTIREKYISSEVNILWKLFLHQC